MVGKSSHDWSSTVYAKSVNIAELDVILYTQLSFLVFVHNFRE